MKYIDSAFLGLTLLLYGHQKRQGRQLLIAHVQPAVRRVIRYCHVEYLLAHQ